MNVEHTPADGPAFRSAKTEEHPEAWYQTFFELHDRLDELSEHHRTLARLIKGVYQHSQQTWEGMKILDDRVSRVVSELERISNFRREHESRLDRIESGQLDILSQLDSIRALLAGLAAAAKVPAQPDDE